MVMHRPASLLQPPGFLLEPSGLRFGPSEAPTDVKILLHHKDPYGGAKSDRGGHLGT